MAEFTAFDSKLSLSVILTKTNQKKVFINYENKEAKKNKKNKTEVENV